MTSSPGRNAVTLYRTRPTAAQVETTSFERLLEAWGSVGDWLREQTEAPKGIDVAIIIYIYSSVTLGFIVRSRLP